MKLPPIFGNIQMNSRHLDDLFEASWLKPRVSCHFPSKPKVTNFPVHEKPVLGLHVAGGIWQPTWSIGSTKKKLWKRFRYPKDKKPLRLMEILWVGNRLNCLSKVAALCERLVVVGPKHIPKHIARAFFILYFSLMPSWQQQRLAAQSLLIILW